LISTAGEVLWDYSKTVHPLGDAAIFAPGTGIVPVVDTPYGRLASVICFDADFPPLMRQAGQARADLVLVPANDWQPVHTLHGRVATFRAVENGLSLVRATSNGLAIAVDPLGQTLAMADDFATDKTTLVVDTPVAGRATLYTRLGDSFAVLCLVGLAALTAFAFLRRSAATPVAAGRGPLPA
jgi:apolipoprotein N-acyltransferase